MGLDEAAMARLVSVFQERLRLGCDLNVDLEELSQHLAASNKPSALVSMKLAEMRAGKPIGPCRYQRSLAERGMRGNGEETPARSRDRESRDSKEKNRDGGDDQ